MPEKCIYREKELGSAFIESESPITQEFINDQARRVIEECQCQKTAEAKALILLDYLDYRRIVDLFLFHYPNEREIGDKYAFGGQKHLAEQKINIKDKHSQESYEVTFTEIAVAVQYIRDAFIEALKNAANTADPEIKTIIQRLDNKYNRVLELSDGSLYKRHLALCRSSADEARMFGARILKLIKKIASYLRILSPQDLEKVNDLVVARQRAFKILTERMQQEPSPFILLPIAEHDANYEQIILEKKNLRSLFEEIEKKPALTSNDLFKLIVDFIQGLQYLLSCRPPLVLGDISTDNMGVVYQEDQPPTGVVFDFDALLPANTFLGGIRLIGHIYYRDEEDNNKITEAEMVYQLGYSIQALFVRAAPIPWLKSLLDKMMGPTKARPSLSQVVSIIKRHITI